MTSSLLSTSLSLTSSFIVVPALMEHNSIPGITNTKPGGLRKLLESVTKVRATVEDIESMLTEVLQALILLNQISSVRFLNRYVYYMITLPLMNILKINCLEEDIFD